VFSTSTVLPLNKANEVLSYYIYTILDQISITNSNTQLLINVVLQIVNIIVAVGMCFFVDRLGRRLLVGYTIKILPYNIRAKVQARCLL
jgi:hypothetical protein